MIATSKTGFLRLAIGAIFVVLWVLAIELIGGQAHKAKHGKASWYGEEYRGKEMANGQLFDPDAMTCAARDWPIGTLLEVWHGERRCIVTVTDRGPAKHYYRRGRIIDLSRAAFASLDPLDAGIIEVEVFPMEEPKVAN